MRLLILLLICQLSLTAQDLIPVTVTKISDGDTFWAKDVSGENIKFRPIGFDCPEEFNFGRPAEPFNQEATAYTTSLIADQTVFVECLSSKQAGLRSLPIRPMSSMWNDLQPLSDKHENRVGECGGDSITEANTLIYYHLIG